MLKCNLHDLTPVSNEEVQYAGFFCIKDFYLFIICIHDDIELANYEINRIITKGFVYRSNTSPVKMHIDCDDKNCYTFYSNIFKKIENNYDKIYSMYPEFDKFIYSREDTSSKEPPDIFR